tara:strand:- start:1788 stop:2141 length:354 start_codon:yes stop_codon:yes gene_type:complete
MKRIKFTTRTRDDMPNHEVTAYPVGKLYVHREVLFSGPDPKAHHATWSISHECGWTVSTKLGSRDKALHVARQLRELPWEKVSPGNVTAITKLMDIKGFNRDARYQPVFLEDYLYSR